MCGITGILQLDGSSGITTSLLREMNDLIAHRGPDDDGIYLKNNAGLAMRRLSIVDLSTGHQPLSNETGDIWIVYNGEIYNHAELRRQLERCGHIYRTRSDTETIVHLYEQYGTDCVHHLRGMFAFAIWDERRQRLFCARDRLGIKPFYYTLHGGVLLFASEIKSLLTYPGVRAELDRRALREFLALGYVTGEGTLFQGICKLLPGHRLVADSASREITVDSYWDLPQPAGGGQPDSYYVRGYRELLQQAVGSHLMGDVPVGMLLSGGLDSSAVAALMQKSRPDPIATFSVGYSELACSELQMARRVAAHIGSRHYEVVLDAEDMYQALPHCIYQEDEPLAWPSSVSLNFVCRLAREHVKVILTGEGSDETLGGYSRYALTLWNLRFDQWYRRFFPESGRASLARWLNNSTKLNARLQRAVQHTFLARDGSSLTSFYFDNFYSVFSSAQQAELLQTGAQADALERSTACWDSCHGDLLSRMLYTDTKTYLVELLMKQDQMSMAASIESRVPYLDHVLVEFAARIPARLKIHSLSGKQVLKKAVADLLPESVIHQRKRGFPTPWRTWLRTRYLDRVEAMLLEPRTEVRALFRPAAIQRLCREHRSGSKDNSDRLWLLLNLELWHRIFIDQDPDYAGRHVAGMGEKRLNYATTST